MVGMRTVKLFSLPMAVVAEAHQSQTVKVQEEVEVAQGVLAVLPLAQQMATVVIQISRVRRRAVLMVVEVGKVRGLATQVAPQNTAVEAVALGMKVRLMASMVVALFTEQVLAEVVARRTILAEMEGCGITH